MKRPTFFISSTIYDFRDLRSALKFFLEELGCKVLASEFNDFEKPLDEHSYDACLKAIHSADYFILLIGSRIGGWYREGERVSITQREYREAYGLQAAGKLKLLNFVRSEVWTVREDRRSLVKYLETTSLDAGARSAIANHQTQFAEDAEFLAKFVSEVSRNVETKLAVRGQGDAPTGNWIHTFTSFRDVVDVLHQHVLSSIPVEDQTVKRLLRCELRALLAQCLIKIRGGQLVAPRESIEKFHKECPITLQGREDLFTTVPAKRWDLTASLSMHLLARKFHITVLPHILAMPTFLTFDVTTDAYVETPAYQALVKLQDEIRRLNECNTSETISIVYRHSKKKRVWNADSEEIETLKLASFLHLLDRWSNVTDLCTALLDHLDGQPFELPPLRSDSPVQGMQAELDNERPTEFEVDAFLAARR